MSQLNAVKQMAESILDKQSTQLERATAESYYVGSGNLKVVNTISPAKNYSPVSSKLRVIGTVASGKKEVREAKKVTFAQETKQVKEEKPVPIGSAYYLELKERNAQIQKHSVAFDELKYVGVKE